MENLAELHAIMVPTKNVVVSDLKLREAQTDRPDYAALKTSIAGLGVISPIIVRPAKDPETQKEIAGFYDLCNGCQRLTISRELNLKNIPALVTNLTDEELQGLQLTLNKTVATKKSDEVKQIKRMILLYPQYNVAELATLCGMEYIDVYQLTGLSKLKPEILEKIDGKELKLVKALSLSKLPENKQEEFLKAAINDTTEDFSGKVTKELKNIKRAAEGLKADTSPIMKVQKKTAIEERLQKIVFKCEKLELTGTIDSPEYHDAALIKNELEWVMSVDAETLVTKDKDKEAKSTASQLEKAKKENENLKKKLAASDAKVLANSGQATALGIN